MRSFRKLEIENEKYVLVDIFKFIFSIVILLHHSYKLPSFNGEHYILQSGALAVDFFFIISGYFMMKRVDKNIVNDNNLLLIENIKYIFHTYVMLFPFILFSYILGVIASLLYIKYNMNILLGILASCIFELSGIFMFGLKGYYINSLTWFISAMLIAKFLIYPIALKCRNLLAMYISPILVFICLGFFSYNFGCIGKTFSWGGIAYIGVYRAIMGILAGCVIFELVKVLKIKFVKYYFISSKIKRNMLVFLEFFLLLIILWYMQTLKQGLGDFVVYFIFCVFIAVNLLIETVYDNEFINRLKFINKKYHLGDLSLAIYLNQNIMFIIFKTNFHMNMWRELCIYIIGTFLLSIIEVKIIDNISGCGIKK